MIQLTKIRRIFSKSLRENNIRNIYLNKINDFGKIPLNTKIKLDTGKFCNAKCHFCYYYDSISNNDRITLKEAKDLPLKELFEKGIDSIEFSGGEPTLVKDLPEIISYILSIDKNITFGIVSNGWKIKEFKEELIKLNLDHSLTDILFSLHGDINTHDAITNLKGSYAKIISEVDGWLQPQLYFQNLKLRINIVICGQELNEDFYQLIKKYILNGIQINFLPLNHWEDSSKYIALDYYNQSKPEISNIEYRKGIYKIISDIIYNLEKDISNLDELNKNYYEQYNANLINIRYAEICKLDEVAHKYAIGHFGHFYDKLDWNKIFYPNENETRLKNNYNLNLNLTEKDIIQTYIKDAEISHYADKTCSECIYFKSLKCDGLKLIDQVTGTIIDETPEEYKIRNQISKGNNQNEHFQP